MKTFLARWTPDWIQNAAGWLCAWAKRVRGKFVAANPDANDVYPIGPDDYPDFPDRAAVFGLMCFIRELHIDDFNALIAKELTP